VLSLLLLLLLLLLLYDGVFGWLCIRQKRVALLLLLLFFFFLLLEEEEQKSDNRLRGRSVVGIVRVLLLLLVGWLVCVCVCATNMHATTTPPYAAAACRQSPINDNF
jgi:hypothetical protein